MLGAAAMRFRPALAAFTLSRRLVLAEERHELELEAQMVFGKRNVLVQGEAAGEIARPHVVARWDAQAAAVLDERLSLMVYQ